MVYFLIGLCNDHIIHMSLQFNYVVDVCVCLVFRIWLLTWLNFKCNVTISLTELCFIKLSHGEVFICTFNDFDMETIKTSGRLVTYTTHMSLS